MNADKSERNEKKRITSVIKNQKKNITGKKDECNFKEWKNVLSGSTTIFNGKKLSNNDFVKMFETIRTISSTEVGLTYMVSQNYEEAILARGMIILRDEVKEKPGHMFLNKLGEVWTNFNQNILPTLQLLFSSIPTHGMTVRQMTIVAFRDNVVLKLKVEEALNMNDQPIPKSIKQMFCILLQAYHDNSDNYEKLEKLASRVIRPFLSNKGLFFTSDIKESITHEKEKRDKLTPASSIGSGGSTPEIEDKANHSSNADSDDFEELMNFRRQKFNRFAGGPQRLSCVDENKGGISESLASLIADGFEIG